MAKHRVLIQTDIWSKDSSVYIRVWGRGSVVYIVPPHNSDFGTLDKPLTNIMNTRGIPSTHGNPMRVGLYLTVGRTILEHVCEVGISTQHDPTVDMTIQYHGYINV